MSEWNAVPVMLLMLLGFALATAAAGVLIYLNWRHRHGVGEKRRLESDSRFGLSSHPWSDHIPAFGSLWHRPASWLAIQSRNLHAVEAALGLHNTRPCTWTEGLADERKLFIAPPVEGWILVIGSGLPEVETEADSCFKFLVDLSRRLGRVQFFSANSILKHHAWAWAENGRIVRAYAWAGSTLWNQGIKTSAELNLRLACFGYFEGPDTLFGNQDVVSLNTDKVPMLAARWSLDPASIDKRIFEHAHGIAGEPPRLY